ncbi:Endocytosis and vacuole integrity protein [Malassezia yamatoensis]|uniref:Endocytosis and vacuole integrity protein n=1 Tax=Malassezia yamatoensis TaxID=253288 RepID=A0AAJ6CF63_9BASI|nr:Endocytosis and vacuole integrity protein [Malassezia yamatoensis]
MPQRIVTELQALAAETRRRYPEVRQAAENVLQRVRNTDHTSSLDVFGSDPSADQMLVQAIVLAWKTKASKPVLIGLSLFQRSIPYHLIPEAALGELLDVLHTLQSNVARTDVDVQLKILQTIPALLADYPSITSKLLSNTLMLCFSLYTHSRVTVVSSTAAATLRQNIMTVFDKVHAEDRAFDAIKAGGEDAAAAAPLPVHTAQTPDGNVTLFPASSDAYFILVDLCSLANGEAASFLPLQSLSKTFVLELLESLLTNHARLFACSSSKEARHPELLYVLRSAACPFLLKAFSEVPSFPVSVRLMRLVRLLLRQFSEELILEIEILLRMVLKTLQDTKGEPLWHRVLALEVVHSLCADADFLHRLYSWYDAGNAGPDNVPSTPLFAELVASLATTGKEARSHLIVDPSLAAPDEQGAGDKQPRSLAQDKSYTLYGAASAAVAGVRNAAEGLLSTRPEPLTSSSAPVVQLLDQLDKVEAPQPGAPPLPLTYMPLLVLWNHAHLAQSLAWSILSRYAEEFADVQVAPSTLTPSDELASEVAMLRLYSQEANDMLAFFLTVQTTDYIFDQTLLALSNFGQALGVVGLSQECDRVLVTLSEIALPSAALAASKLNKRNWAAQLALSSTAIALAGSLGPRWRSVLQTLACALALNTEDSEGFVASTSKAAPSPPLALGNIAGELNGTCSLHFLGGVQLGTKQLRAELDRVFSHSFYLSDQDFARFTVILATLATEQPSVSLPKLTGTVLDQIDRVASANIQRIATELPEGAWLPIVDNLFKVMDNTTLSTGDRARAAAVFDSIAYNTLRTIPSTAHNRQRAILLALHRQACAEEWNGPVGLAIRKAAMDTLLHILEAQAHRLQAGWDLVFKMCRFVADQTSHIRQQGMTPAPYLKTTFACVQLISSNYLASLNDEELKQCIASLPSFCAQTEDTNLALKANGVLWDITADVYRRQTTSEESVSSLWLLVLQHMRDIANLDEAGTDVRSSAISSLFQVLVQYHTSLQPSDWTHIYYEILFPLYDAQSEQECSTCQQETSLVLVIQGTARTLENVTTVLSSNEMFFPIWSEFLDRLVCTYQEASRPVAQAGLDAMLNLFTSLQASAPISGEDLWQKNWSAWVEIGSNLRKDTTSTNLVTVVALLEPLYKAISPNLSDTHIDALLRTLENSVRCGIGDSDPSSARQLYALIGSVHKALERLPNDGKYAALRLQSLASYVQYALDAVFSTPLTQPLEALRVQLAEDLLLHWQSTYLADPSNLALYRTPVSNFLNVICTALQNVNDRTLSIASIARETLCHISRVGVPIVANRLDEYDAKKFYTSFFTCVKDVLTCRPSSVTSVQNEVIDAQVFTVLVALERDVFPVIGKDTDAFDALAWFLPLLVSVTELHSRSESECEHGSLVPLITFEHERVVFWTWDLLFVLCGAENNAHASRKLPGTLLIPYVMNRCSTILKAYVADVRVRGRMPLPRIRLDEVNYVLSKLAELQLPRGAFHIALRTRDPHSVFAMLQTYVAPDHPLPMQEELQQSPIAHLFYLQKELNDCATLHTTQQGSIGTSLAPLQRKTFEDLEPKYVARATLVQTKRTSPNQLALHTQFLRNAATSFMPTHGPSGEQRR